MGALFSFDGLESEPQRAAVGTSLDAGLDAFLDTDRDSGGAGGPVVDVSVATPTASGGDRVGSVDVDQLEDTGGGGLGEVDTGRGRMPLTLGECNRCRPFDRRGGRR